MIAIFDPIQQKIIDYSDCVRFKLLDEAMPDDSLRYALMDGGAGIFAVYEPTMRTQLITTAPDAVKRSALCVEARRLLFDAVSNYALSGFPPIHAKPALEAREQYIKKFGQTAVGYAESAVHEVKRVAMIPPQWLWNFIPSNAS